MPKNDPISEKWPWNGEFLRLFLILPSTIGVVATVATLPFTGIHACWFLTGIPVGALLYAIYNAVGRKVVALAHSVTPEEGECAQALVVHGKIQSPGIAVLGHGNLRLHMITGHRIEVGLKDIADIHEGRWLPGKYLWGKRAFSIKTQTGDRLAFAVPESIGAIWSSAIHDVR